MKNALCLGSFDGIHSGHRSVLSVPKGYRKIAVTFKMPPKSVMSGNASLIMTLEDKCASLKEIGAEEIFLLDFNEVKDMSAFSFLEMLKEKYKPSLISCGFNYRFGKGGEGDTEFLSNYCRENKIEFLMSQPVKKDGEIVSSTMIRGLLKDGDIKKANEFLFKPFSFCSSVIEGDKRGRTMGFPTINQKYPQELVNIKFGVYKTKVLFENECYDGITNIGKRPTFETDYIISETYIKNFSGDLYGKNVRIIPLEFLREEKKFSSVEELKEQILIDIES